MIEPCTATVIVLAFLVVWAVIIPILGAIPKVKEIVSFRYAVVIVFLACMIGVVVNYHELDSSLKLSIIISAAILSGIFIIIRSIEKWMTRGWKLDRDLTASLEKGDAKARVKLTRHDDPDDRPEGE